MNRFRATLKIVIAILGLIALLVALSFHQSDVNVWIVLAYLLTTLCWFGVDEYHHNKKEANNEHA